MPGLGGDGCYHALHRHQRKTTPQAKQGGHLQQTPRATPAQAQKQTLTSDPSKRRPGHKTGIPGDSSVRSHPGVTHEPSTNTGDPPTGRAMSHAGTRTGLLHATCVATCGTTGWWPSCGRTGVVRDPWLARNLTALACRRRGREPRGRCPRQRPTENSAMGAINVSRVPNLTIAGLFSCLAMGLMCCTLPLLHEYQNIRSKADSMAHTLHPQHLQTEQHHVRLFELMAQRFWYLPPLGGMVNNRAQCYTPHCNKLST
jgi:hypothetical protein